MALVDFSLKYHYLDLIYDYDTSEIVKKIRTEHSLKVISYWFLSKKIIFVSNMEIKYIIGMTVFQCWLSYLSITLTSVYMSSKPVSSSKYTFLLSFHCLADPGCIPHFN